MIDNSLFNSHAGEAGSEFDVLTVWARGSAWSGFGSPTVFGEKEE